MESFKKMRFIFILLIISIVIEIIFPIFSLAQESSSSQPGSSTTGTTTTTTSTPTSTGSTTTGTTTTTIPTTGGTTSETITTTTQTTTETPQTTEGTEEGIKTTKIAKEEVSRFGVDYFANAKSRIINIEKHLAEGKPLTPQMDPMMFGSYVGPLEMVSGNIRSVPQKYILSPGDKLTVYLWGDMVELTQIPVVVNQDGVAVVPKVGVIKVHGMTLEQFEKTIRGELERKGMKAFNTSVFLDQLRSIQIYVTGEAFRPGAYSVSSVTTLFNALYACGGPTFEGSLRDIRLIRNGVTTNVDFYKYLINGDGTQDYSLLPGDNIFIGHVEKLVTIKGEVNRPAIYELRENEGLNDIINFAKGLKPTAIKERIQIKTVNPNNEIIIRDVNLLKDKITLYSGDVITVLPINPIIQNVVVLKGMVELPGIYELKKGMRVADLFAPPNKILGEAYLEKVNIIRWNEDYKTTKLITINLEKALGGDPKNNILLEKLDTVILYSKWEVQWIPERKVNITGSVVKPGVYDRADSMRVSDLILLSGGLLPGTYTKSGLLLRRDDRWRLTEGIVINIQDALDKKPESNILLKDGDVLHIYKWEEFQWEPRRVVRIGGAVQRPGTYNRTDGMTLRDLIFVAGGLTPDAFEKAFIAGARNIGTTNIKEVNLKPLLNNEPNADNPLLNDEDLVFIQRQSEFIEKPMAVEIYGEVKYPGVYALKSRDERLSDVIKRAGGLTPHAFPKGTVFKREVIRPSEQMQGYELVRDLIAELNDFEYERQKARAEWMRIESQTSTTALATAAEGASGVIAQDISSATALGRVQTTSGLAGQTTAELVEAISPTSPVNIVSKPRRLEKAFPPNILFVDLEKALKNPGKEHDLILKDNDVIIIPQHPKIVSVAGAVMNPSNIGFVPKKNPNYYIKLSGGYAEDANIERTVIIGVDGSVISVKDKKYVEEGDLIYVPTKVMAANVVDRWDKIISATKFVLATTAAMITTVLLVRELK